MKNAIASIVGAVIISATVSVVQGQSIFDRKGICKNPIGLSDNRDGARFSFMCDAKIYTYLGYAPLNHVEFRVIDLEQGNWTYIFIPEAADSP